MSTSQSSWWLMTSFRGILENMTWHFRWNIFDNTNMARTRNLGTFLRGYLYAIYWKISPMYTSHGLSVECLGCGKRHREFSRPSMAPKVPRCHWIRSQVLGFSSRPGHLQPNPQKKIRSPEKGHMKTVWTLKQNNNNNNNNGRLFFNTCYVAIRGLVGWSWKC